MAITTGQKFVVVGMNQTSSGFNYLTYGGLVASWINSSGTTESGGFLTSWDTEAGTISGATFAATEQPTISGTDITPDGSNDHGDITGGPIVITGDFAIFAVYEIDGGNRYILSNDTGSNYIAKRNDEKMRVRVASTVTNSVTTTTDSSGVHIFYWGRRGTNYEFAYDLGTVESVAGNSNTLSLNQLLVNSSFTPNGLVKQIIVYSEARSTGEISTIQGEMNTIHSLGL